VGASLDKKRLRDQEMEYLRNVDLVIGASAALEAGEFEAQSLDTVAARGDKLGRLARTFQAMASEVQAREQRLKQEVQMLRIEIDEAKASRQAEEIGESAFFQHLVSKAERLRFTDDDLLTDGE
jgi:DNA repair ATPase RecN